LGKLPQERTQDSFYEVVALLARAGAKLDPKWYEDDDDRGHAAEKIRADPRMLAALSGALPRCRPAPGRSAHRKRSSQQPVLLIPFFAPRGFCGAGCQPAADC